MRGLVYTFMFSSLLFAKVGEKDMDPCSDPLIRLAQKKGVKAVPLKDILKFKKLMKECEENGGKEKIKQLHLRDWNRDYKKARRMAGWTSTHAMCVFVSFGYYFIGKIYATKP
ncbi:MAG: hypothetical protein CMG60_08330 [Candidatus Marinimicrobia bacterium]|nr:hypothetical protein [Candidatus Neomarinimicrobiota bacterium]|tara:strand:+ start:6479 stop:6817 length:339 start_codon:yes stop_codon:yes gene_type:complete